MLNNQDTNRDLSKVRSDASNNIQVAQERNKRYFDNRHKAVSKYEVNDYVVITNVDTTAGVNHKLIPKYKGPYVVTKVLPNDRYLLEDIPGFQVTQKPYKSILEPSRMKLWLNSREESILDDPQ